MPYRQFVAWQHRLRAERVAELNARNRRDWEKQIGRGG
jgi:hypothetical protein